MLDEDTVNSYADAVADPNVVYDEDGRRMVPPMAIAALSLGAVINDLEIPGGTVHASQELEFPQAVLLGSTLVCKARMVQNSVRGEWRFMAVGLRVADDGGAEVITGKSTIMLPAEA